MAVSSFTGRRDPFAEYEDKESESPRGDIFAGVDLSGVGLEPAAPLAPNPASLAPNTPDLSTLPIDVETDAQQVARVQDSLFGEDDDSGEFSKGFSAGTEQILGLYGAAKATFGSVIDDDQMVSDGISYYQEKMREAEKYSPNVGTLEEIDFSDEGGFGRLTDYLGYTFGNVLPSMAISIGTGGITGLAAGSAARYLSKEGAQEALEYLAKQQIKDQSELSTVLKKLKLKPDDFNAEGNERLQELIREDMGGALAKDAAARAKQDYINSQAFKYGLAGSASQSVTLNVGENFGEIYERTGVEAPGTAIAAGLAAGALDTFATPLRVAKSLTPDMLDPLRDHLSKEALRLQDKIQTVLKEVGTTSGVEGMTEATQTIITELAVNFVNNNFTDEQRIAYLDAISSEEARSKIMNSAAAGVIGGFGVSATTQTVAAGVDQIRGREPAGDVRQQLMDDRIARMDAIRESVREIVDAEFTDIDKPGLPAPEQTGQASVPVEEAQPASTDIAPIDGQRSESALDDVSLDTLETINLSTGISVQELAEASGRTVDQEQQIVNALFDRGSVEIEVSGGTSLVKVTTQGTMDLFPPEFDEPELVDLPPVSKPAATTTVETEDQTVTTEQTLEDLRGQVEPVAQEPTVTPGPVAETDQGGRILPVIGDQTQSAPIGADRVTPSIAPLTDENRVIEKPTIENTNEAGAAFKITYPDSGNEYLVNRYPSDAGGGFFAFPRSGKADDTIDVDSRDIQDVVTALRDVERQARSTSQSSAPAQAETEVSEVDQDRRVSQPDADPKLKRDPEFDFNGEYVLTYPDGDVRTIYYDEQNRGWYDADVELLEGYLGENRKEAISKLKEIRQAEFDQQQSESPRDDVTIEVTQGTVFPGLPLGSNRPQLKPASSAAASPSISSRLTRINLAENQQAQMGGTGDTFTQKRLGSMSLLMRNLDGQGPLGSPMVRPDGSDDLVRMRTMLEEYRGDLGRSLEDSPEVSQYLNSLLEIVEQGMPIEFVTNTNGVYVNPHRENVQGSFYPSTFSLSFNPELLRAAANDPADRARLKHVVAHEHWHLADQINNYSANLPEFSIKQGITADAITTPDAVFALDFAEPVGQLYDEWSRGTEIGKEFHYPFANMGNSLAEVFAESPDSTTEMDSAIRVFEKEVFAQAGAVFIGNPDLLKADAPEIYNVLRRIQAEPLKTAGQLIDDQNQRTTQVQRDTSGDQVPGDFRSRTRNRSVQIPISGRGGQDSGGVGLGGQALRPVEGSPRDGDRDTSGRTLRETPALDIREDQKYLYQKPRGNVRGKFAINKKITPANSDQQLQLLSELVARHPNVLDSAAKYTAFEKDLTGGALQIKTADGTTKENLVLRPPHYLIKLFNDMDLWVETHSKLRGEQLEAASAGLETAKKMGELYADGAATPASTAKLMLWGMLSRMLTASAQESAFVDLMTKMPGQNADPVNDLVEKALTGGFTDEMVTRTVVTDKSKGTTKEVTLNRDVADWRDSVSGMIPEGSFGKSGTSNANDFGSFMLKMSEMAGNQSKLARLHDLVSDRSISTSRVRQEFQSMMGGAGIDNKVFSFLMLMTGRDDVLILDRIQLNTMWDTGRYGKLIYDDIAENFGNLHGLARYEVLENALQSKIVELYTRLGRPEDASVGRYHWESWVLNSGQVVAHPTMQGLVADIMDAPNPYAFMGAPEGKQNMYRYGAIYARDDQGQPYYLYADSKGTPYKLSRSQFEKFLGEIQKPKNGIVPKNFKVSEYDEGFPWYEADGVDRAKLDEVLKANAERKADEREYALEGDVLDEDQTDGSREGLEPTPSLDMGGPGFRGVTELLGTRNQLVADLERAAISQGELVADISDADLDEMSPDSRRLMKALRDDDWLGFDRVDDLLVTIFDEGLDGFDASIATKIALGRYVNQNYGGVSSALDMVGDNPNKAPSNKFNEEDATNIVKDLQFRLEKILPFYRGLMDQYVDMKQLERKIAAKRGMARLPADESFYDSENLMHGRAAYELDLVQKNYLEPIKDILSAKNIDVEGLGKYLLAKHAPERNAVIAQKAVEKREKLVAAAEQAENQRLIEFYQETPIPFQDYETEQGGSGISNAEAIEILALAERDGLTGTMDEASQLIYDMLKEHRDRMVKNQLLDAETVEDWESRYKFYVPLKGFAAEENIEADYTMSDKTRGFSITGSESLKAKGRTTLPANPVVISILDVAAKIKRGEKNRVSNVLLDMLENSGFEADPEINEAEGLVPWTIWNNRFRPKDPSTDGGTMVPMAQMDRLTRPNGDPRFITVKRGGQTFFIEFKDNELNRVIQKLGESPFNQASNFGQSIAGKLQAFQNFRRNMLINYNPSWGLVNPLRDVVTAIGYSLGESGAAGSRTEGKDVTARMVYNYPNALRAYWRNLRETEGRGRAVTERGKAKQDTYDQYVKEYFEDGAPTGLILTRTYEEEVAAIERDINAGKLRRAFQSMGKFVEDFNQTMENAARVSAYVEARKAGAPRANAATLAKDLTVNFNRKGESNATINLGYLFFNAAQQGTQNFIQALGQGGKKVPALLAGLFGAGYTITLYNIAQSEFDDDDEVGYDDYNDSQLKRSINIVKEGGAMVAMPLAYSYQFFFNAGRILAEYQHGLKDEGEAFVQLMQSFIDNFSPVDVASGEGPEELRGLAPDVLELWLDLSTNLDFFGGPIQREQFPTEPKKAQVYVTKRSTSKLAKDVMQRLNDLDGSEYRNNEYLPYNYLTPDRIDYVSAWLMGGLGRFIGDASDVAYKAATDPGAIELVDYPIVGQFYKEPSEYKDQMEFYQNSDKLQSRLAELDATPFKERDALRSNPELAPFYDPQLRLAYDAVGQQLRVLRKAEIFHERELSDPVELRLKLEKIDADRQKLFDRFNKKFRAAERKARGDK